ncbi:aldo/keto reductase [Pedobacter sp. HMF7647]|uniref:Aldo/keto reductase n=1 Tax=Hufsiella arboris TaxID=2695275 RepID=A0A7K1YD77_9SPHI|nr:aldo/keto reductase [Hufsiella arboris]MXV52543.1 aldo/keto reductase [Hufsiella arboris]
MKKRKLGKSELEVYPWAFGGNVCGWTIDEKASFNVLDSFIDHGFDFIDTADVYSKWVAGNKGGESEAIIGNWLQKRKGRDKIILATKVGSEMEPGKKGLSKDYILSAVEASLRRLKTDYIDLYQSHYEDPETPIEETLSAYQQLLKDGKVRVIGASNYKPSSLEDAINVSKEQNLPAYQTLQPEYNLFARQEFETELQPICVQNGLGVITYFSLASGFLTGKYRTEADFNKSKRGAGMKKYLNKRGEKILKALDEVSNRTQSTPAQVSLAWLLTREGITAPIASATSSEQISDLSKAFSLNLDEESLRILNEASEF